jgi:hypothetical protein
MWKAIVQSVSKVDSIGRFEVLFSIFVDDVLEYPQISVSGDSKNSIGVRIKEILKELKDKQTEASEIRVGDEFTL